MKIIRLDVLGLLGKEGTVSMKFNDDINILTGRNGSGKTSVLKLIWFIVSGNILLALKEVNFRRATLLTSEYECTVHRLTHNTCRVDFTIDGKKTVYEDTDDDFEENFMINAEDKPNELLSKTGSSIFLPTFRRIEGGFSTGERNQNALSRARVDIEESLISLAKKLTNGSHVFVSALSTIDIVTLLVRQYTDLSETYTRLQQTTSQDIISKIKDFKQDGVDTTDIVEANQILDTIRQQIEGMEESRETIMKPIEAVKALVTNIFKHSGIKLSKTLSFGDAASAVNSDALSAGEKQMLSFISYNAFYENAVIVIDEPELSLHVDWQRQLFPILRAQQSSNQFLIATHSPFIYSKYPDKEIQIDTDRGDGEVN